MKCRIVLVLSIFIMLSSLRANPTGGNVTSGSATISGQGTGSVNVKQTSGTAIINWNSFSIDKGQSTQFIMPSSQSAALNRVLGGSTSLINGNLTANGQLFLINQNGIFIGPNGMINAASFTGSTRDITDDNFKKNNLHFNGNNNNGVTNLGTINAGLGNVALIGKTVTNGGIISAGKGTANLTAADDVLLAQKNADGSTVTVNPSPLSTLPPGSTGVTNTGSISASAVELKAAGGNIYALAINNSGTIRASTLKKQGGRIYLSADSGDIINTGTLNASGRTGGSVNIHTTGSVTHSGTIKATGNSGGGKVTIRGSNINLASGSTINTSATQNGNGGNISVVASNALNPAGAVISMGGQEGGNGGNAELSGYTVSLSSPVLDLLAAKGHAGTLLLDPANLYVEATGTPTGGSGFSNNPSTDTVILASTVATLLSGGNLALQANNDVTVDGAIVNNNSTTLTLQAGRSIIINANITSDGGLNFIANDTAADGVISADRQAGAATITMAAGTILNTNFTAISISMFGGTGGASGNINLQTINGDVSVTNAGNTAGTSINLAGVVTSNSLVDFDTTGAGDMIYDTAGFSSSSLYLSGTANWQQIGSLPSFSAPSNLVLQNTSTFLRAAGGTGTTGNPYQISDIYGLQGINSPSNTLLSKNFVQTANISATTTSFWNSGAGFVPIGFTTPFSGSYNGANYTIAGIVIHQTGAINVGVFGNVSGALQNIGISGGSVTGSTDVGGLVGSAGSNVTNCYATDTVGGLFNIGGLIGQTNTSANVTGCYATGAVTGTGTGDGNVGGFVGINNGTIGDSYSTGNVNMATAGMNNIGGFVGVSPTGTISACYSTGNVTSVGAYVGGFSGGNILCNNCYSTGNVSGADAVGGFDGLANTGITNCYSTGSATSTDSIVGYFIGDQQGTGTYANCYGASGVGGNATQAIGNTSQAGVTSSAISNFTNPSTFAGFDFTLFTGVWGINGYSHTGLINSGMPFFQWQYPIQAQIVPSSQVLTYSGTTGALNPSAYTVNGSLTGALASGPTLTVIGSNINVGGTPNTIGANLSVNTGYVVEVNNSATVTYTPRPITVTGNSVTSTYGPTGPVFSDNSSSQVIGSDSLGVAIYTPIGTTTDAGTGYVNAGGYAYSVSYTGNPNYNVSYVNGAWTVNPKPITITSTAASAVTYGTSPAFSDNSAGQVYTGDTLTLTSVNTSGGLDLAGYYNATASGTYNIVYSNPNYLPTYTQAAYVVNPKPITVSALDVAPTTYGPTSPAFSDNGSAQVYSGDSLGAVTYMASGGISPTSGYYNATSGTYTPSYTGNPNYTIVFNSAPYTINPAPITVSAIDITGSPTTYGPTSPAFANDGAAGQLYGSDVLGGTTTYSASGGLSAINYYNAGTYLYTPSITGANSNYAISCNSAPYVVLPQVINVSGSNVAPVTYANATPAFASDVASQVYLNDTVPTAVYVPMGPISTSGNLAAGTYNYLANFGPGNYAVNFTPGTYSITTATLQAQVGVNNKVYDGTKAATLNNLNGSVGVVGADNVTISSSYAANFASQNVGNGISVNVSGLTLTGADAADYSLVTNAPYSAAITPATLTYTATPQSVIAGTPFLPFTGSLTGFVPGESIGNATTGTLNFSTTLTDSNQVGVFSINGSGLSAQNYVFVQNASNSQALVITSPMPVINQPPVRPTIPSATGLSNDTGGSPFLPAGPGNDGNSGVIPPDPDSTSGTGGGSSSSTPGNQPVGNPVPNGTPVSFGGSPAPAVVAAQLNNATSPAVENSLADAMGGGGATTPSGNTPSAPLTPSTPGNQPVGTPVANNTPVGFDGSTPPAPVASTLTTATSPAVESSLSDAMNGANSTPGGQPAGTPVANNTPVGFDGSTPPAPVASTLTTATSPAVESSLSDAMNGANSTPGGQPAGTPVANNTPVGFDGSTPPAPVASTLTTATSPAVESSLSDAMNGANSIPGNQPAGTPVANNTPVGFDGSTPPAPVASTLTTATSPAVESSLSDAMNGANSTPGNQPAGTPVANNTPVGFDGSTPPAPVASTLTTATSPAVESSLSDAMNGANSTPGGQPVGTPVANNTPVGFDGNSTVPAAVSSQLQNDVSQMLKTNLQIPFNRKIKLNN